MMLNLLQAARFFMYQASENVTLRTIEGMLGDGVMVPLIILDTKCIQVVGFTSRASLLGERLWSALNTR